MLNVGALLVGKVLQASDIYRPGVLLAGGVLPVDAHLSADEVLPAGGVCWMVGADAV